MHIHIYIYTYSHRVVGKIKLSNKWGRNRSKRSKKGV